jgi:hypothetical protein
MQQQQQQQHQLVLLLDPQFLQAQQSNGAKQTLLISCAPAVQHWTAAVPPTAAVHMPMLRRRRQ